MDESERIALTVEPAFSGMRLDAYLREQTPFSRSRIVSLMEEGAMVVNGEIERKAARKTEEGMRIILNVPETKPVDIVPQDIPLDILYQDADVVVVNKKSGMVVHPAAGNESGTLVNALLYHVHDLSGIGGEMRPGIVHRLDKDTSGLILIAKNDAAHAALSEQFKQRTMEKHYRAVAHGSFSKGEGLIDAPIGRHPIDRKKMAVVPNGKPSRTEWACFGASEWRNLFGRSSTYRSNAPNPRSHAFHRSSIAGRQNICAKSQNPCAHSTAHATCVHPRFYASDNRKTFDILRTAACRF